MRSRLVPAAVLLATWLGVAGCGGAKEPDPHTQTTNGIQADFGAQPDPPTVGHDNTFVLTLSRSGQPVTGEVVNVQFLFKGLNKEGPAAVCSESQPGRYEAREISTGMGGKWEAVYTLSRSSPGAAAPQTDAQFTFPFDVHR